MLTAGIVLFIIGAAVALIAGGGFPERGTRPGGIALLGWIVAVIGVVLIVLWAVLGLAGEAEEGGGGNLDAFGLPLLAPGAYLYLKHRLSAARDSR